MLSEICCEDCALSEKLWQRSYWFVIIYCCHCKPSVTVNSIR